MKKLLTFAMVAVLGLTILFTGCGKKEDQTGADESLKYIKDNGKFIVGLDDVFPPMGFRDENGEIVGFDIDAAKEVAKRLGVQVDFKPIDWKAKEMELKSKKIDVIWNGLSVTPEREQNLGLSTPYLSNTQAFIVKKGSDIKSMADMKGKKIGLQNGSSSLAAFEKNDELKGMVSGVEKYDKNKDVLLDLKVGRIDVALMDKVVAKYYVAKEAENYEFLEDNLGTEDYAVGFRKEDKAFKDEVNKIIDEMKKDGTMGKISEKWFGENIVK